jgi:hypothetical protein
MVAENEKPLATLAASARGLRVLMGIGSLACCEIRRNQRLDTSLLYAKEKLPKNSAGERLCLSTLA